MDGAKTRPGRSRRRISRKTFLGLGAVGSMGLLIGCGSEQTQGGSEAGSLYFGEEYRPRFHFSPEVNWINDPNGLVYYDGEYHMYFQYNPYEKTQGNLSWGHAVSEDLLRWEELPVALEPDELGLIFSGGAVVDRDDVSGFFDGRPGLVAFYTNHDEETEEQVQSIAYSTDRGRTWTKYSENPVIPNPGIKDFRDPKVIWHEETQRWVLALAAGDRAMFYSSENLIDWTELSEFGAEDGAHGGVWECPELFRLPVDGDSNDQKWVLLISINPGAPEGGSGSQYFVGDFDGTTFSNDNPPETELWADYGKDFYAAQAWSDVPDGRRIWIGWMNNWDYSKEIPTDPWAGSMSLPREVTLTNVPGEGVRLVQTPVAELTSLRTPVLELADTTVSPDGSNALSDLSGKKLELLAEFEPGTAREFGIKVRKGEEVGQETIVGYDAESAQLFVDRSDAGPADFGGGFPGRHEAPMKPADGRVRMQTFVDHASVEVFGNDGVAVITDQIFPDPESEGLELYAEGGEARLISLEAYDLEATQG